MVCPESLGESLGADQGVLTHSAALVVKEATNVQQTKTDTKYTYTWWDEAKLQQIKLDKVDYLNPNASTSDKWADGFSEIAYDQNGHIQQLVKRAGNVVASTTRYTSDGLDDGDFLPNALNAALDAEGAEEED